jgi:UDP-N-acetylglucosamine:LPS N-acetylglucosamine transferase
MMTIDLVWFNAGGGHRAAAQALEQVVLSHPPQGQPWNIRKVNLTEVLFPSTALQRATGLELEDYYNKRLASGFTLGLAQELKLLQQLIRFGHSTLVQRLERHWRATQPDMVVSLLPNFNRCLHDSLARARPGVPFVTVLTDMADHPPHFWIEPGVQQHLVCGTAHAAAQALAAGCDPQRIHRTSGMIVRPEFYAEPALHGEDRINARHAVGLDADTPTGLVLFGGTGSRVMKRIAQQLPHTPLILMCGRNHALAEELRAQRSSAPRVVLEFTPDVAQWMAMADFFIGKPGPGSLSEAVLQGLPVIVTRNAWTMPQERWNTEWVQQHGVGIVHRSFATVQRAVDDLLKELPSYRARVAAMHNRAVFEVPRILERILTECSPQSATAALQSA